jgi:hypothetical protein
VIDAHRANGEESKGIKKTKTLSQMSGRYLCAWSAIFQVVFAEFEACFVFKRAIFRQYKK